MHRHRYLARHGSRRPNSRRGIASAHFLLRRERRAPNGRQTRGGQRRPTACPSYFRLWRKLCRKELFAGRESGSAGRLGPSRHFSVNTSPLQRSDSLPGASRPVIISHLALTPGTRLGPYEITAQLGAGGMGEACRATDTKLDRVVAIIQRLALQPGAVAQRDEVPPCW